VNGDGTITSTDMAAVRAALLQRLPATEPTAPQHDVALPGAALPAGNGPAVCKDRNGGFQFRFASCRQFASFNTGRAETGQSISDRCYAEERNTGQAARLRAS